MQKIKMDRLLSLISTAENKASSDDELIVVSDENGRAIGALPRLICHSLGVRHKTVFLVILDSSRNMLLQTRNDSNGIRYDLPVAGHVSASDRCCIDAVRREATEEIGLTTQKKSIKPLLEYSFDSLPAHKENGCCIHNKEYRSVYYIILDEETIKSIQMLFLNRTETQAVTSISWFSIDEVERICEQGNVADGLSGTFPLIKNRCMEI